MEKEQVKKFDLEAAFKALDEIEIPVAEKGIKANRVNFKEALSQKPAHETLIEDYYDIRDNESLEEAQEEREGEVAQAKLARIEKIVDLDADTADDLLPSYVGKVIIQCPQCMTLFYKNPEDIDHSEENPDVVNINEICQHCGNSSGYTLIGKVDSVSEEEAGNYEPTGEENELDLDFDVEEPAEEEQPAEENAEGNEGEDLDLDLDLDLEEIPEGEANESLNLSKAAPSDFETENKSEKLTLNEETENESLNKSEEAPSEHETENGSEETTLNEEVDKDLDKKLKDHNDYIAFIQAQIKEAEEALKGAENDEIKDALQRRLDSLNVDLESALPDAVKGEPVIAKEESVLADEAPIEEPVEEPVVDEAPADEVPAEEVVEEEPVEENLTEETNNSCKVVYSDNKEHVVFTGTKEQCEQIIEKNKDKETAKQHGLEIVCSEVEESLNKSEAAPSENETENKSENLTLNEGYTVLYGEKDYEHKEFDSEEEANKFAAENNGKVVPMRNESLNEKLNPEDFEDDEVVKLVTKIRDFQKESGKSQAEAIDSCCSDEDKALLRAAKLKDGRIVRLFMNENLNEGANDSLIDSIIASWGDVNEELKEEASDAFLDSPEFQEPVSDAEVEAIRDEANENLEECNKATLTEDPDEDAIKEIMSQWSDNADNSVEEPVEECGAACQEQEDEPLKEDAEEEAAEEEAVEEEQPAEAEEEAEEEKAEEEAQPIETTVEEVKEIATEVAEQVAAPVEGEEEAEKQQEEIQAVVDEVVEEKFSEEKPEEGEAEEAEEVEEVEDEQEFDFDDLQEESFNTHVKDFLTEVYENVADFAATSCELKEGKLFIEGKISFKSGKEKLTMFEFLPNFGEGKLFLEGCNKDFSEDKAFTLNCSLTEAKELVTESFGYKYKINEALVEGLK